MICERCREGLNLRAIESPRGWYIGRACRCGRHSRESRYYPSEIAARQSPLLSLESAWVEMVLEQRAAVNALEQAERELGLAMEDLPASWRRRIGRALEHVRSAIGELESGPEEEQPTPNCDRRR
jgi:hypothetical protein